MKTCSRKPGFSRPIASRMVSKVIPVTLGLWLLSGGISLPSVSGWEREAILDPLGKVHLAWTPHLETKVIEFEYTVQTLGWVGLGFSPTGGMRDSDVITAWIKNGQVFFDDRHVPVDHELPRVDDVSNYNLISAVETDTATIIRFTREFDTCDLEQDYFITRDTVKVIYAFGETDPEGEDPFYHGSDNRGTKSLYLLDPPLGEIPDDPSIKEWIVSSEMVIPEVDTTYWCTIQKTPEVDVTHHIIGYKPYVKPGNEKYVHHLLLFSCSVPDELVDMFNSWSEHSGVLCFGPDHPPEWYLCRSTLLAWAVGGEGETYPENVGYVMPEGGMFFMMEMHYDNPEMESGIQDNSGLTVYYTDVLRPMQMATLEVGASVGPTQIIPARQSLFVHSGHCSPRCTEVVFPPEGIHVFSGLLHSHLIECEYDSSERDSVTLQGFGTTEEMCLAFFQYYPAQDVSTCSSYPDFEEFFTLFDITDIWLDQENGYEYMVSENQTLVDYLNEFDWSGIDLEDLQYLLRYNPHYVQCLNNMAEFILAVRFTVGFCLVIGGISLPHVSGWEREAILDPLGKVQLAWTPHLETKVIEFEYTVQTLGWVGLGFSPTGGMLNSDVITAWVKDGQVFFSDRHVPVDHELPRVDDVPNYNLISAVGTDTATIIRFTREFDTCDLEQDFYITGDTIKVIYAYGEADPDGEDPYYHGIDNRGTKSLYLLDPPLGEIPDDPLIKEWTVSNEMVIPEADTTYWCSIQKTPIVEITHHIIGSKPYVKPGNEKYVHHLILYACSVPDELVGMFDSWAEQDGVLCYGSDHPQEWHLCRSILIGWAVGGEGETYPENVGYVLPEGGMFFMLEMHYDNPEAVSGIQDDSGLTVYYTDVLRPLEMTTLQVGAAIHAAEIIPSGQKQFFHAGHCSSLCTSTVFPPEGIHVFSGLLHSHLIGRKMRVRVFRNGEELPWLLNDDNYDFNYQQVRVFREHITLYPGDQLIIECDYDSSGRDSVTVSGFGTTEEMCMAFLQYYPALNVAACNSYPNFEAVFSLFGITDVWVDQDEGYEYMVSENQTLVDYLNEFDWSGIDMEGFQDLMRYDPHYARCISNRGELILAWNPGCLPDENVRLANETFQSVR
ncbi:unnamed protein product [Darwinula stevensoni]|uniref:DOMON domain-containing protein n=1 Tax=Darwinula stevensoni TaxID=69355 RepID=A0A7R9FPK6_9CRUS|nr:unnamed protein product [Darwinula stevensoni]CAG0897729.1 unnamed protein product [Darwinula stevensoni]